MRARDDTHALLWFLSDDRARSPTAREVMCSSDSELLFSIASCWEMAIKHAIGKLTLGRPFQEFLWPQLRHNRIEILPIHEAHLNRVAELAQHHRDPFDRLLAAQAATEGIAIISGDSALDVYGVSRVW